MTDKFRITIIKDYIFKLGKYYVTITKNIQTSLWKSEFHGDSLIFFNSPPPSVDDFKNLRYLKTKKGFKHYTQFTS